MLTRKSLRLKNSAHLVCQTCRIGLKDILDVLPRADGTGTGAPWRADRSPSGGGSGLSTVPGERDDIVGVVLHRRCVQMRQHFEADMV